MLTSLEDLLCAVEFVYGAEIPIKPLRALAALPRLQAGEDMRAVAKSVGTTAKSLTAIAEAPDPILAALGCTLADAEEEKLHTRGLRNLGGLLLGYQAERQFETIFKSTMGTKDLQLQDDRESRNDTDYRVLNGNSRPVFRINIKFFGSKFRNAQDLVGLDPDDCFALATYKIKQGLDKHELEVLPYLFVIVGVSDLTGDRAGTAIPEDLRHLCALIQAAPKASGKRGVEDTIVSRVTDNPPPEARHAMDEFARQIAAAKWYVLSARRADALLKEKLFERVYAVRVRAFARNYPNAELDMHFSLRQDLTPLTEFLAKIKDIGLPQVMMHLERGLI